MGVIAVVCAAGVARATPLRWPVEDESRVTAYVDDGEGRDWRCEDNTYAGHRGTDVGVLPGTAVLAAAAGRVTHRADGFGDGCLGCFTGLGFGNHVELAHGGGESMIYGHLTAGSGLPEEGARVPCGARVGASGASGNVTGPHLHFELREGVVEGSFYSGRHRDPFAGPCSANPRSDWVDQGEGDPARRCVEAAALDGGALDAALDGRATDASEGGMREAGSSSGEVSSRDAARSEDAGTVDVARAGPGAAVGGCGCGLAPGGGGSVATAAALLGALAWRRRRRGRVAGWIAGLLLVPCGARADGPWVWWSSEGTVYRGRARDGAAAARATPMSGRVERLVPVDGGAAAVALVCPQRVAGDALPADCALHRVDERGAVAWTGGGVVTFDVAATGALAYSRHEGALVLRVASRERTLSRRALWPRFDGTGRRVVWLDFARGGNGPIRPGEVPELVVYELPTGGTRVLDRGALASPVLTWDGGTVLYLSARGGLAGIYANGWAEGVPRRLTNIMTRGAGAEFVPVWTQDLLARPSGRVLYVASYGGLRTLWSIDGGAGFARSLGAFAAPQDVSGAVFVVEGAPGHWRIHRLQE